MLKILAYSTHDLIDRVQGVGAAVGAAGEGQIMILDPQQIESLRRIVVPLDDAFVEIVEIGMKSGRTYAVETTLDFMVRAWTGSDYAGPPPRDAAGPLGEAAGRQPRNTCSTCGAWKQICTC